MTVFLMTASMFGAMSIYGYTTKQDLTTVGNLCLMGLFGLIIASVVNLFLHNDMTTLVLSWFGVVIFVGLTAYDTQKIKKMNIIGNAGTDEDRKEAISGALTLYLDFINLFLNLLRIFGKGR
jgi:FtsH-binding integral membrane protein